MTEFEKELLEEINKKNKEYEDLKEGCHQYALALLAILGIGFLIALIICLSIISSI